MLIQDLYKVYIFVKTNIYTKYAHNFAIIALLPLMGQHLLSESKLADLPVYSVNARSLRGRSRD